MAGQGRVTLGQHRPVRSPDKAGQGLCPPPAEQPHAPAAFHKRRGTASTAAPRQPRRSTKVAAVPRAHILRPALILLLLLLSPPGTTGQGGGAAASPVPVPPCERKEEAAAAAAATPVGGGAAGAAGPARGGGSCRWGTTSGWQTACRSRRRGCHLSPGVAGGPRGSSGVWGVPIARYRGARPAAQQPRLPR